MHMQGVKVKYRYFISTVEEVTRRRERERGGKRRGYKRGGQEEM